MTSRHRITFVKKDLHKPATHQITHVGGYLENGTPWTIPVADAIDGIQSGRFRFFLHEEGAENENIIVARSPIYGTYLKTERGPHIPTRLLRLPEPRSEEDYY